MGRAGAVTVAGTLNITSNVLPAAIKTSVWTRGAAGTVAAPATCTPGTVLPSSAIKVNPLTGAVAEPDPLNPVVRGVVAPPGMPAYAANTEGIALVLSNARPLMR